MSEIRIEYGGEVYFVRPTNKLLRRIDAELYPSTCLGILSSLDGKQAPLPALSLIIAMVLNEGGADVDEDVLFSEIMDDVQNNKGKGVRALLNDMQAIFDFGNIQGKNSLALPLTKTTTEGATKPGAKRKTRAKKS